MAEGSVCVSPGMLETKVMVAPNSPMALAKHRIEPGDDAGQDQRQRDREEHPGAIGAERASRLLEPHVDRLDGQVGWRRTISGKPMTPQASAAPVQRNEKTIPKCAARKLPIGPRWPNRMSSR